MHGVFSRCTNEELEKGKWETKLKCVECQTLVAITLNSATSSLKWTGIGTWAQSFHHVRAKDSCGLWTNCLHSLLAPLSPLMDRGKERKNCGSFVGHLLTPFWFECVYVYERDPMCYVICILGSFRKDLRMNLFHLNSMSWHLNAKFTPLKLIYII